MSSLTPLSYQILLALAEQDRHGYGIIKDIESRGGEDAAPSTGAMYLALQRMDAEGLIEDAPERPAGEDDARRRYYRITKHGRAMAELESRRLEALVEAARTRKLLAGGGA